MTKDLTMYMYPFAPGVFDAVASWFHINFCGRYFPVETVPRPITGHLRPSLLR